MELVTVYPAVPPKAQGYSSPGSILVTYEVPESESVVRGYFSFTLRAVIMPDGSVQMGTMDQAISMAQDMLRSHLIGEIEISPECLWRDPADQRPADNNRKSFDPPPAGKPAPPAPDNPNQPTVKTFVCVKVEKERDSGKTWLRFYMKNGRYPCVRVHSDEKVYAKACGQLHEITNIDWAGAELGTSINCDLVCGYTESGQKKTGNPYWNFYGIRAK